MKVLFMMLISNTVSISNANGTKPNTKKCADACLCVCVYACVYVYDKLEIVIITLILP